MTVMFCDIVDSTVIAERLDPEDFRELLSGYQAVCAQAIERFEGYAAQWVGDGVLAYFGYPWAHEDDARRGVYAALAIIEEIAKLNRRTSELLGVSLMVRIGLHSGLVVAGEMGAGQTRELRAIVGETPHIASRLQAIATPGTVVLTQDTLELAGGGVETEPLGGAKLKGISRSIELHRVIKVSGEDRGTGAHRPLTPIVDRTGELRRVVRAWRRAREGQGVLVHVIGEAGIGKSRLVQALREEVAHEPAAEHVLQCSPHQSSSALYPVIRFLEVLANIDRSAAPQAQHEALASCAAAAGLDGEDAVPLLADLLSLPGSAPPREMLPRDARNATLQALEALLVRDPARHPLLLVVEDLHWADPTTIELLRRITGDVPGMPVAFVLTFRRDFDPPWSQWHPVLEIDLGPLAREHVRVMASAASPRPLDSETLQRVESVSEGVPLFVEEMVKVLAAPVKPGLRAPVAQAGGVVPPTLRGLLSERLDRLPELAGVIDVAAVLGREFERGVLQVLSESEASTFSSAIARLTAEDVLRPVEGSRSRLEFKHALLQEVAYDRMLRRRRRDLHGRVAELLLARGPAAGETESERIAHHFTSAGKPAKAVPYWELAGRRALKRAAFLEAAEHFRRAVEALREAYPGSEEDLQQAELLTLLAAAVQAGRTPAADVEDVYARARRTFERAEEVERLIPILRGQWTHHWARAEYAQAMEVAEQMFAMGDGGRRPACLAEGHLYLGLTNMYIGELDRARANLDDAFQGHLPPDRPDRIYEAQGDTGVAALAYLSIVLWNQGETREALERSDLSLELADRYGGPVTLAQAWGMRGGLLIARGKFAQLVPWLEKTLAHSSERNIGYWRSVCSIWSAWLQGRSGQLDVGIALLREHIDAYLALGNRLGRPHFSILLADLYLLGEDSARALAVLREGERHLHEAGEALNEPELYWWLARALTAGERPDEHAANDAYGRAADAAERQGARLLELRAVTGQAILQRRAGFEPSAMARVRELCDWFGLSSEVADVVRARTLLQQAVEAG